MHERRGYTIENILINTDDMFDDFDEDELNQLAEICMYKKLRKFQRCVNNLIRDYHAIMIHSPLLEWENELHKTSISLSEIVNTKDKSMINAHLKLIKLLIIGLHTVISSIKENAIIDLRLQKNPIYLEELEENYNKKKKINSIYRHAIKSIKQISRSLMYLVDNEERDKQCKKLIDITANIGVMKIQHRLEFCMNTFLNINNINLKSSMHSSRYSLLARKLGEFCFNEGERFNFGSENNSEKIINHNKNLLSLVFYFMSSDIDNSTADINLCFTQILKYQYGNQLARVRYSSLKEFAEKYPLHFTRLSNYLFHDKHEFSDKINYLLSCNHAHVYFNQTLFQLYESIANNEIGYSNNGNEIIENIKIRLIKSLKLGLMQAEAYLSKYFNDDLQVNIALALIYYKTDIPKWHNTNNKIFQQMNQYDLMSLVTFTDIYVLFDYWLKEGSDNVKKSTANLLQTYILSYSIIFPWNILKANAIINPEYAPICAKIAVQIPKYISSTMEVLKLHADNNKYDIKYHIYKLSKVYLDKLFYNNPAPILEAANEGYREAIDDLLLACKNNKNGQNFQQNIVHMLDKGSPFFTEILVQLYHEKKLLVDEICNDTFTTDHFLKYFIPELMWSLNASEMPDFILMLDKIAATGSQYKIKVKEILYQYCKTNAINAMLVIRLLFSLSTELRHDQLFLKEINKIFKLRYDDYSYMQKYYCMYKINFSFKAKRDLVIEAFRSALNPPLDTLNEILINPFSLCHFLKQTYVNNSIKLNGSGFDSQFFLKLCTHYLLDIGYQECIPMLLESLLDIAAAHHPEIYEDIFEHAENNSSTGIQLVRKLASISINSNIEKIIIPKLIELFDSGQFINLSVIDYYHLYLISWKTHPIQSKRFLDSALKMGILQRMIEEDARAHLLIDAAQCDFPPALIYIDHLLSSSSRNIKYVQEFVSILKENADSNNSCQYIAAEALCVWLIKAKNYRGADHYFDVCCALQGRVSGICNRLAKENIIDAYRETCDKAILEQIDKENYRPPVSSRIGFFEHKGNQTINDNQIKPSNNQLKK